LNNNLLHVIIFQSAFLAVILGSEIIYRVFRIHAEITRKIVHVGLCLVALGIPSVTHSIGVAAVLIILGSIALYFGNRFNIFRSINDVSRKTIGGPAILAALFICFTIAVLLDDLVLFYIPVLILAFGDSAAGLTGVFLKVKRWPGSTIAGRANKSYAGSIVFFLITFLIVILVLPAFYTLTTANLILTGILIGIAGTLCEAFSPNGYDNITVPIAGMLILLVQHVR